MSKQLIRTRNKPLYLPEDIEHPSGEDMCIPGEEITINEMLHRFTNGVLSPIAKNDLSEDEEPDFDDYDKIRDKSSDIIDYHNAAQEVDQVIKSTKAAKAKLDQVEAEKEKEKLINAEVEKRLKEKALTDINPKD